MRKSVRMLNHVEVEAAVGIIVCTTWGRNPALCIRSTYMHASKQHQLL